MPSIKWPWKKNPYAQSEETTTKKHKNKSTARLPHQDSRQTTQRPQTAPASPRGSLDFLAEAREAVGRDRVTGKQKPRTPVPPVPQEQTVHRYRQRNGIFSSTASASTPDLRQESTNAGVRARQAGLESGTEGIDQDRATRYVREMTMKRAGAYGTPAAGYYAPPPMVASEYYGAESWQR